MQSCKSSPTIFRARQGGAAPHYWVRRRKVKVHRSAPAPLRFHAEMQTPHPPCHLPIKSVSVLKTDDGLKSWNKGLKMDLTSSNAFISDLPSELGAVSNMKALNLQDVWQHFHKYPHDFCPSLLHRRSWGIVGGSSVANDSLQSFLLGLVELRN